MRSKPFDRTRRDLQNAPNRMTKVLRNTEIYHFYGFSRGPSIKGTLNFFSCDPITAKLSAYTEEESTFCVH
jgi:hypothetical protein